MEKKPAPPGTSNRRYAPAPDPSLTLRPRVFEVASLAKGDDERFELEFMEEVVSRDPCNEEALMVLGSTYTRRGEYDKGLDIDRRLAKLRPADPTAFYNLACSYSLLKRADDGLAALKQAIALGYRDLRHMMADPDLANLRDDGRFRRLAARLVGRSPSNS